MKKHLMRLAVLLVVAGMLAVTIQVAIPRVAFAQQPGSDLFAGESAFDSTSLPSTATSAQAGTVRTTTKSWDAFLYNNSQTSVTNPKISIQSGYDPSLYNFTWMNQPVTAFPVTDSRSSLDPGQGFNASDNGLGSNIPVTYTLGYNSTRTVSPSKIPVGGTNQTVSITVTLVDSRYVSAPPNVTGGININVGSNLSGVSLVSFTNPNNLKQGEVINNSVPSPALFGWSLSFPRLHKTYRFSATLHVPNASGSSFRYRPSVVVSGVLGTILCVACSGSSVTIADATLDGSIPGSGGATFSVTETNHTWTSNHYDAYNIIYDGT